MSRATSDSRSVVAVIGTTGVGKSQLAVTLAQSLRRAPRPGTSYPANPEGDHHGGYSRGVVLSADSMQIYKGLDVITNKVTRSEMGEVEHWGLDLVQPGKESSWELGKWCNEADAKIKSLTPDTLPIICGGTHYFIQHFLFPPPDISFDRPGAITEDARGKSKAAKIGRWEPSHPRPALNSLSVDEEALLDTFWTANPAWAGSRHDSASTASTSQAGGADLTDAQLLQLHRLLRAVDPAEAGRWHWRDGRKVRRGLERWWDRAGSSSAGAELSIESTATPLSEAATRASGRKARFRTLVFWVYEPMETLRPRLDRRVDSMVENGLLREIAELRGLAKEVFSGGPIDYTDGIFQAIGFKEFEALPLDHTPDATLHPAFKFMLDRMKLSTHQYAKSQLKWIRKQLLPALQDAQAQSSGEVFIYVVPGGRANERVTEEILRAFLDGGEMPDSASTGNPDAAQLLAAGSQDGGGAVPDTLQRQQLNARVDCDVCSTPDNPYSVLLKDWDTHIKSRLHKRNYAPAKLDRAGWIEEQKKAGQARKAARAAETPAENAQAA